MHHLRIKFFVKFPLHLVQTGRFLAYLLYLIRKESAWRASTWPASSATGQKHTVPPPDDWWRLKDEVAEPLFSIGFLPRRLMTFFHEERG